MWKYRWWLGFQILNIVVVGLVLALYREIEALLIAFGMVPCFALFHFFLFWRLLPK